MRITDMRDQLGRSNRKIKANRRTKARLELLHMAKRGKKKVNGGGMYGAESMEINRD